MLLSSIRKLFALWAPPKILRATTFHWIDRTTVAVASASTAAARCTCSTSGAQCLGINCSRRGRRSSQRLHSTAAATARRAAAAQRATGERAQQMRRIHSRYSAARRGRSRTRCSSRNSAEEIVVIGEIRQTGKSAHIDAVNVRGRAVSIATTDAGCRRRAVVRVGVVVHIISAARSGSHRRIATNATDNRTEIAKVTDGIHIEFGLHVNAGQIETTRATAATTTASSCVLCTTATVTLAIRPIARCRGSRRKSTDTSNAISIAQQRQHVHAIVTPVLLLLLCLLLLQLRRQMLLRIVQLLPLPYGVLLPQLNQRAQRHRYGHAMLSDSRQTLRIASVRRAVVGVNASGYRGTVGQMELNGCHRLFERMLQRDGDVLARQRAQLEHGGVLEICMGHSTLSEQLSQIYICICKEYSPH